MSSSGQYGRVDPVDPVDRVGRAGPAVAVASAVVAVSARADAGLAGGSRSCLRHSGHPSRASPSQYFAVCFLWQKSLLSVRSEEDHRRGAYEVDRL
jgi:hypothetical protein